MFLIKKAALLVWIADLVNVLKIKYMKINLNTEDLLSFGKYLFSEERSVQLLNQGTPFEDLSLRLEIVTKKDVDNWIITQLEKNVSKHN